MMQECWFVNYCFPVLSDPTKVTIIQCNLLTDSLPKIKRTGMKEHLIKKMVILTPLVRGSGTDSKHPFHRK